MNTTTLKKLENGNIELTIQIPWASVQETYAHVLEEITQQAEIPGFRKGKAPKNLVEENLDKNKTYEEVLKHLLPDAYSKAVTEQSIKPIIPPQITLTKAKEGEDWTVTAVTCEKPEIKLGEYKKEILEIKSSKGKKIWVPGQEPAKQEEKEQKLSLDDVLDAILKTTTITLPAVLVEQEVTRLLSNFLDQTKKLGLTLDQYLSSTGKTIDTLKKEYEEEAKRSITLELALGEIAEAEKVNIEDKEIEEVINTAKTPEEKAGLEKERYYLASILRRQKTIQLLSSL